jgi:hypothetical protein
MPNQEQFHEGMEFLEEAIPDINDEINVKVHEEIEEMDDGEFKQNREENNGWVSFEELYVHIPDDYNPNETYLFLCNHGPHNYLIRAEKEDSFVVIQYHFDLRSGIAAVLSDEQITNIIDDSEPDEINMDLPVEDENVNAAMTLLSSIEEDHMQQLKYLLSEKISSPLTSYHIATDEDGVIHTFHVSKKFFPYSDDKSLSEFEECVQSVISQGSLGKRYLSNAFIFDLEAGETDVVELVSGL